MRLAEGCEQSIAALHALHRVYSRALLEGSAPVGVTAAAAAAASAAATAAMYERRCVLSAAWRAMSCASIDQRHTRRRTQGYPRRMQSAIEAPHVRRLRWIR